jgi:phosphate transport system substrate-binding protein
MIPTRIAAVCVVLVGALAACGGEAQREQLAGTVQADGSSTVYPITEAVAEEFRVESGGGVRVLVAQSGTGGGFKRFCTGETDISNASRPIQEEERLQCEQAGVEPVELTVAWDGLAVLVHSANDFAECLTVDELKKIWEPGSTVRSWSEVRAGWPDQEIKLYGPGTNSGTFDYFTEEIVGEAGASRSDYTASEDDNVLVQGVSGDPYSLGYFGFAYYVENQDKLKLVGVDSGQGCVQPEPATIEGGQYSPLSRPIFIYVNKASLQRPAVREFVDFYLQTAPELVEEVGYVPLTAELYQETRSVFEQAADAT